MSVVGDYLVLLIGGKRSVTPVLVAFPSTADAVRGTIAGAGNGGICSPEIVDMSSGRGKYSSGTDARRIFYRADGN